MKKTAVAVLIAALLACMAACRKETTVTPTENRRVYTDDVRYLESYQGMSVTEEGCVYIGYDSRIHFIPTDTDEDIILCYDPNCYHEIASWENPDPECRAALFKEHTKIAYYEGTIYYFVEDGVFSHTIYKMEADGGGREKIATMPFSYNLSYYTFREDKLYYMARFKEIVKETENLAIQNMVSSYRLIEFDLKDYSYRFIDTEETKDILYSLEVVDNTAYLRMTHDGAMYNRIIDLITLEDKLIITPEEYDDHRVIGGIDDNSYFYFDNIHTIGIAAMAAGERTPVIVLADNQWFGVVACLMMVFSIL